jgi:hypothetical protein
MRTDTVSATQPTRRGLVVALHCSGAGASQWRWLGAELGGDYELVAPEHYGCENIGAWTGEHAFTLAAALAGHSGTIAERNLRTETGEAGGNPEAGWRRGTKAWHPTVLDRIVQQAVMQVLQRRWNPTFSQYSYGFRPRRSALHAVAQAQRYIAQGNAWVIDLDLQKFFDRVNHDKLMGQIAKRIEDKRLLKLIRAFLNAGVMENGLVSRAWKALRKEDRFRHC